MSDVGSDARWRKPEARYDHSQFLLHLRTQNRKLSPIWSIPWICKDIFRRDWLHCSDQGICPDFLGNLFKHVRTKMPGRNIKMRTQSLNSRMQAYYSAYDIKDKLPRLTPQMIQQSKKPPKLRGSAACCRALVPFAARIARTELDRNNAKELAMISAAESLQRCYECLAPDPARPEGFLKQHSILFAQQYKALSLHAANDLDWRMKPKFHIWLELCSENSCPSRFWCYRDEDYGGTVAALAHSRGGASNAHAMSIRLVDLFRIKQPMIRILR